ncbi:MAG TPA: acetyl-CoA carboxylase biotin carboxyl carrier protein subunit [Myxococcota bacterium]|nr:acetyl-CoA carboxylase biotin carboxyl carrier protein subunit [Myxococcota bacterium]HQP94859.1 acetyl-CoA carboxylase biotin carboxyl carrier protein subunit [Myxococcota bacterium]
MMSRQFKVKVNGRSFDVEVEEIGTGAGTPVFQSTPGPARQAPMPVGQAQPVAAPVAAPAARAAGDDGPGWVQCPMAGKVQKIPVKVGDSVSPETVVTVLEAMKMETSVCAGTSGTIQEIATSEGTVVDSGARLVRIA